MAKKVGIISINLVAGTAQFNADLGKAKAKVIDFGAAAAASGHGTRASMIEASAAIRAMEGNFNNNIRAVERFTSITLGLGPLFNKLFPLVGGLAFGSMLFELGGKVLDFYKTVQEGPRKMAEAFREINAPLRAANDEMAVVNDRLENEIAKLQGRRQNTLKLALDEAKVAADHLADSLDKDLQSLEKLLKEQSLGWFRGFVTGQASTKADEEDLKKFTDKMARIDAEGDAAVRVAKTKEEAQKAQAAWDREIDDALNAQINKTALLVQETEKLQSYHEGKGQAPTYQAYVKNPSLYAPYGVQASTPDQTVLLKERRGVLENLNYLKDRLSLNRQRTADEAGLDAAKAARDAAKLGRPYEEAIKSIDAQIEALRANLAAVGQPEAAQLIAKGFGAAREEIVKINKELAAISPHLKLTDAQMGQISTRKIITEPALQAQLAWNTKLDETIKKIRDEVKEQELLTAAIGKGYEATKKASVEARVISLVGPTAYNEPAKQADVAKVRAEQSLAYDAAARTRSAQMTDKLQDQIELERSLAQVQMQGAEAIRLVTLAYRLRELTHRGATAAEVKAEIDLFNAQRATLAAGDLAKINERIRAVQALQAAQLQGAEAERKAALENKYAEMKLQGATPEAIAQTRQLDQIEREKELAAEALRTQMAFQNQLETLDLEKKRLEEIRAQMGDSLTIQLSLRKIEQERLQVLIEQSLSLRGARAGVEAFFTEMRKDAQAASAVVYETLNSAVDKVSSNLSKLLTGQKASWGALFKGLGEDLLKSTIKTGIQKGLGALGKKLGLGSAADGSKENPFWVRLAGAPVPRPGASPSADNAALGGLGKPDGTAPNPFYVVSESGGGKGKEPGMFSDVLKTLGGFLGGAGGGGESGG
ncbi:MAG TPA: phage tail tape measure C-terminal domain-containing protein, partial [Bryobacteraceae bacterium]|nr:phage tail tape measure C-terminal domain-containing protein [Bryobacteraceae bacterium]